MNNFQRTGAVSNAHEGNTFEELARTFFVSQGLSLIAKFSLPLGVADKKREHRFDLGSRNPHVLVECKSHTWTNGDNVPSAKIAVWNEAMYYFHVAPAEYRKILFVQKSVRRNSNLTLAAWYRKNKPHLVPLDVELWEFDTATKTAEQLC